MTVVVSALRAVLNSCSSSSVVSTSTARHPQPRAKAAMPSPGRSSPGTPGVSSSTANDLRMEYSLLAHDHVHDRQLVLSGRPEGLHRVLGRAVADQADDRPTDAPVPVTQRN